MGGENVPALFRARRWRGSSPRGRGKPAATSICARSRRLIPAWAGKTPTQTRRTCPAQAHPRVGGENVDLVQLDGDLVGSSPRGRGKQIGLPRCKLRAGLIPAWAGKTASSRRCRPWRTAHPRVGGENLNAVAGGNADTGSSPRGRGKRADSDDNQTDRGLIPAWAGKTRIAISAIR